MTAGSDHRAPNRRRASRRQRAIRGTACIGGQP
jgi:hypothetical protein